MLKNFLNLYRTNNKISCLLITPPLLNFESIYSAMPILTGQLLKNGFDAKNLDLNIKFFRYILTESYLKYTKKLLDKKKISYDKNEVDFIIKNISNVLPKYKVGNINSDEYKNADSFIQKALDFISLPFKNFHIDTVRIFDCFKSFNYNYQNLDEITENADDNIFIHFFEKMLKEINFNKYDFIAVTIPFIGTLIPALTLAKILKKNTNAYITIGGCFINYNDIIANPDFIGKYCDSVLIRDGEISIVELAKSVEQKKEPSNVNGIIYKDRHGKIIHNNSISLIKMNDRANMSYKGIDIDNYFGKIHIIDTIISKGCYWGKCVFCSLADKYNNYSIMTPQKVVSDIKELIDMYPQINEIKFQDDAIHPLYLSKLADEIIKNNLNIQYFIFARFEKEFTRELLEKLYKSGLRAVFWGLESGCQSVLNKMNKGIQIENVLPILKNAHEIGINNLTGIIINFPTETLEEYKETLSFIPKIKEYTEIAPGNFAVMRNSSIISQKDKFGIDIIKDNEFNYDTTWIDNNISKPEKDRRWEFFVEFIKDNQFAIDRIKNFE